jgi:hypothetical protein
MGRLKNNQWEIKYLPFGLQRLQVCLKLVQVEGKFSAHHFEVTQTGRANGVHGGPLLPDGIQILGSDNCCSQGQANEGDCETKPHVES